MKPHKFVFLIPIIFFFGVFLSLIMFAQNKGSSATLSDEKEYKFLTADFLKDLKKINAEAFYKSEIAYPKTMAKFSNSPETDLEKRQVSYGRAIHYEKVANEICKDISDAYLEALDNEIQHQNIFDFFNEINSAVENHGGYVLPLYRTQGYMKATYYNQNWDKNSKDIGGNRKFAENYNQDFSEKERNRTSAAFKENGIIEVDMDPANIQWHERYNTFMDYALKVKKIQLKEQDYVLDVVQPYLFILQKNPEDISEDIIYLYLDFPYRLRGSDILNPDKILRRDRETESVCQVKSGRDCIKDARYKPEVKCYARSTNLMKAQAQDQDRYKDDKAVAMVLAGEPLGYPIPQNFIDKKAYELKKSEMSDPSLKCWLKLISGNDEDIGECLSPSYADRFMSMVNKDVCVRKTGTTSIPKQDFPMIFPYGAPSYLITQFNERCDL